VKFVTTKKGLTKIIFHPSLLLLFLDPGSGMGKNQDPESGINIPDPQHWQDLEPDPESEPNPLVRGTDPRVRIHTKMSRIRNTGFLLVDGRIRIRTNSNGSRS
jgi:hypothetical protein